MAKRSEEKITLRKLNTLWDEITVGISNPRVFLKSDTQGHDTNVVIGANEHLDEIIGIQSEVPAIEIYDGMTSMLDMLKFVKNLDYVPVGFYEVNRPSEYEGIAPEFDVIFKRTLV